MVRVRFSNGSTVHYSDAHHVRWGVNPGCHTLWKDESCSEFVAAVALDACVEAGGTRVYVDQDLDLSSAAQFILGKLGEIDDLYLRALKRELRNFNMQTGEWKS